jgi:hypothetical protein
LLLNMSMIFPCYLSCLENATSRENDQRIIEEIIASIAAE